MKFLHAQYLPLCGGCQKCGARPVFKGKHCRTCDRTVQEIEQTHGTLFISKRLGNKMNQLTMGIRMEEYETN